MSERIDEEQRAAIEATERAIAILAGPGSGKTRVLSYRARHLLQRESRTKALLLTFTNKAAAEMKSRALKAAPVASDRIEACTFHAFCQGVLRSHGELVGVPTDFEILDNDDQQEMQLAAAKIASGKNLGRDWSHCRARRAKAEGDVEKYGKVYQSLKQAQRVVDFDDLLVCTTQLFEKHAELAAAYSRRYAHLLLDEFQDTNAVQFALVRFLAKHASTISVFADDDQAIFRFAGADAENIVRFVKELGAKEYPLSINYRCRSAIVEKANLLIQADQYASGRQMVAEKDGGTVEARVYESDEQEANAIIADVQKLLNQGVKPESISILVRSGHRAEQLIRSIIAKGIPVTNWLDKNHETKERRVLRMCLSVARDTLNVRHRSRLCDFFDLPESGETNTEKFLGACSSSQEGKMLNSIRQMARRNEKIETIVREVQQLVETVDSELAHSLNSIVEGVRAFLKHDPDFSLEHLLEELSLGTPGGSPTEGGGIKVASLHRTKGLQWPFVYIVGTEDETLPDFRSHNDEQELRQERRLCFVGVCRAEDSLVLTRVKNLRGYSKKLSRFLREMKF